MREPRSAPISMEALTDYLYCSMLYYWKRVLRETGEDTPRTTLALPGEALRAALGVWHEEEAMTLPEAVGAVWRTWLARAGVDRDDVLVGLAGYARALDRILGEFESGAIRKRDGGHYTVPRMARKFKQMTRSSGLPPLAAELDTVLLPALTVVAANETKLGPYGVADAYAESLRTARRMEEKAEMPVRESVLGVSVPVEISVGDWRLPARADMLVRASEASEAPAVTIEVHDHDALSWPSAARVGRDLRLLAALHMVPCAESVDFGKVVGVTYRHLPSGWTHTRTAAGSGRLTFALEAALRGMREGVYIPAFLADLDRCRPCPMAERCLNPGGLDAIEALSPGLAPRADAVGGAVRAAMRGLGQRERVQLAGAVRRLTEELAKRDGDVEDLPAALVVMDRRLETGVRS